LHRWPEEDELYDLVADPAQLHNVADDPACAEIRAELEWELARLQEELGDRPYAGPDTPHPDWARDTSR
jgi:hypothetical protein